MAHFLPMYLGFARFSAVTDGKNALLSLLSNFTAYLLIGAKALYGVLPIGDVLLYAGSVTRAMSDLQTLVADVIVNIASHDRTRIAGFPDFLFNHFI